MTLVGIADGEIKRKPSMLR